MRAVISVVDFKIIIKSAQKFVSSKGSHVQMEFVEITVKDGNISAMALDGFKVVRNHVKAIESDYDFKCFIKPEMPKGEDDKCIIEYDGKCSLVSIGDYTIKCKQPCEKYIDINHLFKHDDEYFKGHIYIDTKLLKDAVSSISAQAVCIYLPKKPTDPLYIKNAGGDITTEQIILPISPKRFEKE